MKRLSKKYIVPLCILIITAISAAVFYFAGIREYKDWRLTEGIVTDFQVVRGIRRIGQNRNYRYSYTYTVEGENYSGYDTFSSGTSEDKTGDKIEVWYDPKEPSKSAMSISSELNLYVPFFITVPLMLISYSFFSLSEKKSRLR